MKNIFFILFLLVGACEAQGEEMEIKLSFNGETAVVKMFDNPASRQFVSRLPLTLTFGDYIGTEKIAVLPEKLDTQRITNETSGDFTYYPPWGNLAIFYKGEGTSSVIVLGKIISGKEKLAEMKKDFIMKIEKAK